VRFSDTGSGSGPRATPVVHEGRIYTLGATGILNALDADTGRLLWSRDAQADTGARVPDYGFAGSPVVVDDLLIVATSGRLVAYDLATGTPRWTRTTGGGGYSSPQVVTLSGVRQVLLLNGAGVTSVAPSDGRILWDYKEGDGMGIVQPAVLGDGDLLIAAGQMMAGLGIRRLAVSSVDGRWAAQQRWHSRGLKPYFNDYVVHEEHAFGFDGSILSCIRLADGERQWKGGRYGAGQMVLLAGQGLLLVLSEEGDVALVKATPDRFTEVATFKAIDGKTWNHPVVIGELLLVRNGEEMAAFRLPIAR
jgi:outer membrane protein assembly factor BamB